MSLYLETALKLVVGLAALLVVIRILGKKELAQVTPFDFIYAVVLGGILEESLFTNVKIPEMLFNLAVWGALIYSVEILTQKFEFLRPVLKGKPSVLIKDGDFMIEELKESKLENEQLRALLRGQGIFTVREVKYAYLETSGTLSVMKYPHYDAVTPGHLNLETNGTEPALLLIDEGQIKHDALKEINKDEDWLKEQIRKEGYSDTKEIYYAEWSDPDGFYIKGYPQ